MESTFKAGQELYYVNPFIFTIEKVVLEYLFEENAQFLWVDRGTGAYLAEDDLCEELQDAKGKALTYLNRFFSTKFAEIMMCNPVVPGPEEQQDFTDWLE